MQYESIFPRKIAPSVWLYVYLTTLMRLNWYTVTAKSITPAPHTMRNI